MKKTLMILAILTMVFSCVPNSEAGYIVDGYVAIEGTTDPVVGAEVTCEECIPPESDYTDANGYYRLDLDHGWCGHKEFSVRKTGYSTIRQDITDHTCGTCFCEEWDLDCMAQYECSEGKRVHFHLTPGGSLDSDSDGVWDNVDNCVNVPNGPDLGTCTRGKRGSLCQSHNQCGCSGYCSKLQENCDMDSYGNACDADCMNAPGGCQAGPCPEFQSFTEIVPQHKLLGPQATTLMTDDDIRVFWAVVILTYWQGHNPTSYDTPFDALMGLFNGPEYVCNRCLFDRNANGICDGEESIYYSPLETIEALQQAFVRCQEQFERCYEDPEYRENNPFDCIW